MNLLHCFYFTFLIKLLLKVGKFFTFYLFIYFFANSTVNFKKDIDIISLNNPSIFTISLSKEDKTLFFLIQFQIHIEIFSYRDNFMQILLQGDQSSSRIKTGCADIVIIIETNWQYRAYMLYIFYYIWDFRCSGKTTTISAFLLTFFFI